MSEESTRLRGRIEALLALAGQARNILIVTHTDPDPDAIGSAVGLAELLHKRLGVEPVIAYAGIVGRAENRAMVRELALPLHQFCQIRCSDYDLIALVDAQPGAGNQPLAADCPVHVVIDHHPLRPETSQVAFAEIHPDYASTSTIVTSMLRTARLRPSTRVATALFYGIRTDSSGLSLPSHQQDAHAYAYLLKHVNHEALLRIEHASVPPDYFRSLDEALRQTTTLNGLVVARLGNMRYPDMAAEVADFLRRLEGARIVAAIGDYAGEVVLSLRSNASGVSLDELVQRVVGRDGSAGGHDSMAAGRVPALLSGSTEQTVDEIVDRLTRALGLERSDAGVTRPAAPVRYRRGSVAGARRPPTPASPRTSGPACAP